MPDVKISALAAAAPLTGNEEFPINQNGASRKVSAGQIRALANTMAEPVQMAAPATLDHNHYGRIVHVGTGGTITLPPAPPTTEVVRILNGSNPAGNVFVQVETGTRVTIEPRKDITFVAMNATWVRMNPQTDGGGAYPGIFIPNRYYPTMEHIRFGTSDAGPDLTTGIFFQPFTLPTGLMFSELFVQLSVAGAASTLGKLALYRGANRSVSGAVLAGPVGAPVAQGGGTFTMDTTGFKPVALTGPTLVPSGLYFMALRSNVGTGTPARFRSLAADGPNTPYLMGSATPSFGSGTAMGIHSQSAVADFDAPWPNMDAPSCNVSALRFVGGFRVAA